jgi:negative regulator of flagellin synthesis FlgM
MDIRSSLDGLKSLLVAAPADPATPKADKAGVAPGGSALGSDLATFSSAASEVSLTATDTGVRADKVAGVQAALAAGSYNVPASAVASKLVDVMLGAGQ